MEYIYGKNRFLEIIPGALTWIILLSPIFWSMVFPPIVAIFIIVFDFYWLVKAIVMGVHLISGYRYIKRDSNIDWQSRVQRLSDLDHLIVDLTNQASFSRGWYKRKLLADVEELKFIKEKRISVPDWNKIYQVVILPSVNEIQEILDKSLISYANSTFPSDRIIVVLAMEERAGPEREKIAQTLKDKYKNIFKDILISIHPDNIVGELKAKGANVNWAAMKILQPYLDQHKITYENVLVSTFDADTRVHNQYFSCITYKYLINPNRRHRTYQPLPIYNNNIWEVPAPVRLVAFGASFWQMIESTRPYRMINFSSQAMSFKTLVDINFWDTTIVSEDSRQYYRAFCCYQGDHKVIPIFTPVYMDAVLSGGILGTFIAQYKQKRRWAWGVEHFPYLVSIWRKYPGISFWQKFVQLTRLLEGHISWSTTSLLIAFVAWLPFLFNPEFGETVLGHNLPIFIRYLLTLTWVGIIISLVISSLLLPPRPRKYTWTKSVEMVLQWVLIPISTIFFGSVPAIDAQTRLMLGKYLGFWVTPKETKK